MAFWDYVWVIRLIVEILKSIIESEPQALEDMKEVARAIYSKNDSNVA